MKSVGTMLVGILLMSALVAQGAESGKAAPAVEAAKVSDAGRTALQAAKQVAARCRGLRGPERAAALEQAATAYDKVVADFGAEPAVAALAAFTSAELWRQQGSLPLAEKGYLLAATADAPRYAQRGLIGAADMQRRQKRIDEALATYAKAAAVEPGSSRAQDARLWQARLMQSSHRIDEAIPMFQSALEAADPGSQTIEAANYLALAWIEKGDLDAAGHVLDHAAQSVADVGDDDPLVAERLHKTLEAMSAKKALQRARDKATGAGKDAADLDAVRRQRGT
ncbi:MAG: hypothetical protein JNK78_10740 [Planctomycetes bacterium]|nr:hypothetical protein [Planctomycetota bacterium]